MRYFLNFKSDDYGRKQIDEPIGMDGIIFSLKQRDKGMGRDVSFSGGEISFEFSHLRKHEIKKLLYYNRKFGFESNVVLEIEIDENNKYFCDLDFANAETDDLEYFKCKGIEDGKLQIVKARKDVKVDLTSQYNIDGDFIGELPYTNMLLLAKPINQVSKWKSDSDYSLNMTTKSDRFYSINTAQNLYESEVDGSETFHSPQTNSIKDFRVLKAPTTLVNINININIPSFSFSTSVSGGGNGYTEYTFDIYYGDDLENKLEITIPRVTLDKTTIKENKSYSSSIVKNVFIPRLERGQCVYISHNFRLRQSAVLGSFKVDFTTSKMDMTIIANSISYNSIHKCYRLSDVMKRVVGSISELNINAPRYELGGEFYDNVLMDGNMLRGINTRKFNVSLDDLDKSFTEMYADWEIGSDGKVFFGRDLDFYKNTEVAFFDNIQFSGMNKTFNPEFKINEFLYKYDKFQSQKETTELGSNDEIHGESTLTSFNKNVENKKEVQIKWIRSAFLSEGVRIKGLEIVDNTATQDDDDIFCFDVTETLTDLTFTEVTELDHTFDSVNNRLILKNNGTLNFITIGIKTGTTFLINSPDTNAGTYTVYSVEAQKIELTKNTGVIQGSGNGIRNTNYTYTILKVNAPLTNYTYQGFSETIGLNSPESYSNRRYSVMRNIYKYYQSYLATANLYWKEKPLKNTWYKNNPHYTAKYSEVKLTEGQEFTPDNPILSPVLYNEMIFANVSFKKFIKLMTDIRSNRGFIRTIDNNQKVVKVYPVDMEFELIKNELRIKAKEKYEPNSMTIVNQNSYILINNETRVNTFLFDFDNAGKLYVYDENRFRLYNGVYWFEVSVNNAIPNSQQELKDWLKLINN